MRIFLSLVFLFSTNLFAADQQPLKLTPQQGVIANVYISGSTLQININGIIKKNQIFELDLPPTMHLTTRKISEVKNPYIEVWHIDEGMGTYTIHHLFFYQKNEQRFAERKPICGEQFINLRPQDAQEALTYSAFDATSNTWRMCKEQ